MVPFFLTWVGTFIVTGIGADHHKVGIFPRDSYVHSGTGVEIQVIRFYAVRKYMARGAPGKIVPATMAAWECLLMNGS